MAVAVVAGQSPVALGESLHSGAALGGSGAAADRQQQPCAKQVTLATPSNSGDVRPPRQPGVFQRGSGQRSQSCTHLHDSESWAAATASKSGGHGTFGSPGRPGLSRAKSAALVLPPIKVKKQPLRFEDLYSQAKVRVSKKAAQVRFGGSNPAVGGVHLNELPTLPQMAKAEAEAARVSRKLAKTTMAASQDLAETAWASQALAEVPADDGMSSGSHTPNSRTGGTSSAQSNWQKVRRNSVSLMRRINSHRSVRNEDEVGEVGGPVRQRRNSLAMMRRMNSHRSVQRDTEDEVHSRRNSFLRTQEEGGPLLYVGDTVRHSSFSSWMGFDGAPGNDLPEILNRMAMNEEGFSDRELNRLKVAFNRFKVPGSADLHVDDVPDLLGYLGRVITSAEKVSPLLKELTSYDYIDFEEFVDFMTNFNAMEREEFEDVFERFDEDESGEISVSELRSICANLGFMPLRKMITEALSVVDMDVNGQLNFDEFVTFLTVYRHAEGFTRAEVNELKESFDKFAVRERGDMMLPPESLCDCLVKVFGLQVSDYAAHIGALLASGQGLQKSSLAMNDAGEPECLSFAEFLIFGRKVRENQLSQLRQDYKALGWGSNGEEVSKKATDKLLGREQSVEMREFERADLNGDGKISEEELRSALKHFYGYYPLRQVLMEVYEETLDNPWTPGYLMDFNEFFDFMLVLRHRDGFLKREVQAFQSIFERFDDDGSGEISALELSDLMRFLGYTASLDLMRGMVIKVDKNESGQLDFNEFLHLMRLYREEELQKMKGVYDRVVDKESNKMPGKYLMQCMQDMGYDQRELMALHGERLKDVQSNDLDFDDLVGEMDECRSAKVSKQRKKAGFSSEELENFRSLFEMFDKDRSGHIDNAELIELLKAFNWQPRTKEGQTVLMEKLDVARSRAREAGIEDVGEDGSANIRFWTFVQLARMLKREMEQAEELQVAEVVKELKLSEKESEQFRSIFRSAINREKEKAKETNAQALAMSERVPEYGLKGEAVRTLIRSLGVQLTTRVDDKLSAKLNSLEQDGVLTFTGFLKLMMWMVEVNFAGVNDAASKYA